MSTLRDSGTTAPPEHLPWSPINPFGQVRDGPKSLSALTVTGSRAVVGIPRGNEQGAQAEEEPALNESSVFESGLVTVSRAAVEIPWGDEQSAPADEEPAQNGSSAFAFGLPGLDESFIFGDDIRNSSPASVSARLESWEESPINVGGYEVFRNDEDRSFELLPNVKNIRRSRRNRVVYSSAVSYTHLTLPTIYSV